MSTSNTATFFKILGAAVVLGATRAAEQAAAERAQSAADYARMEQGQLAMMRLNGLKARLAALKIAKPRYEYDTINTRYAETEINRYEITREQRDLDRAVYELERAERNAR